MPWVLNLDGRTLFNVETGASLQVVDCRLTMRHGHPYEVWASANHEGTQLVAGTLTVCQQYLLDARRTLNDLAYRRAGVPEDEPENARAWRRPPPSSAMFG